MGRDLTRRHTLDWLKALFDGRPATPEAPLARHAARESSAR